MYKLRTLVQCSLVQKCSVVWFKLLLKERDQEVHESYINGFSEKVLFGVNGYLWAQKMTRPNNFGSALRSFGKFYTMIGANRYMTVILMI